ncbi:MAG: 1-deoxy-D-xylulose-5-phosphate reductoisomerase [Sedimentisphaerales bacterium]|nr:1-deoxy-D-xylulose-5-phosphate reductoisomerase [Sedimentisphaerales bacterium]
MVRNIAILGSTGSIGANALRVIEALGDEFRIVALSARSSVELLAKQVRRFRPSHVAIANPDKVRSFKALIGEQPCEIIAGPDSLEEIASLDDVDTVLTAVVGAAGLPAVLRAAEMGKTLAIANKEPLVIAGQLLTTTAAEHNATILPVDSEHSAIFQAMHAGQSEDVKRIILTGSGGPFRTARPADLHHVTLEQALNHPTWDMGPKITIDSATMMNKALEVIEAVWLFGVPAERIDVLIHPESIIHSMVEFVDGSILAQMGTPDMTVPIQYALTYPRRCKGLAKPLHLEKLGCLTFETPNLDVFRSLKLVYHVACQGGSAPVVFNAANEVAVELFLSGQIKFHQIIELIEECLGIHNQTTCLTLDELLQVDAWTRRTVKETLKVSHATQDSAEKV